MRWKQALTSMLCALILLGSAAPGFGLAQSDPGVTPDLSLVSLSEDDCGWLSSFGEAAVSGLGPIRCGTLQVPENWQTPGERRVDIAFVVLESTGDDPAPDPVVYLEGGPGGTALVGVPFYADLFAQHRQSRDIILFDQRGTAHSSPLQCTTFTIDDLFATYGADDSAGDGDAGTPAAASEADQATGLGPTAVLTATALLEQARLRVSDDMARCAQELLAQGIDLRQYNSVNNARDTVALVKSLGYDAYNLYGISYGTRLALVTMREFPDSNLRSVVLDSTYPPGLPGFELYPSEPHEVVIQLFADCFLDPVCNDAYPNLKARFIALLDRLESEPLDLGEGVVIEASDVVEIMQGINGMVQIAPYIPRMIDELEHGEATTFIGIASGTLFQGETSGADPEATPVADDDAAVVDDSIPALIEEFAISVGVGSDADSLSPAQAWLSMVLGRVAALPEGQAGELLIRLFFLDKLPKTRETLTRFVELAFAAPEDRVVRAALLERVRAFSDEDVAEVFSYLREPAQAVDPTAGGVNPFMFNSVECHESVPFQQFDRVVETAVELDIPELGLNTIAGIADQFATCEVWPSGRASEVANRPVSSVVPTLILAGTYDLQTPLSWNKEAFVHLPNAGLLIFPMSGHGVITFSGCARQVTAEFIDDPIYYPDSSCIADLYPQWALPGS